MSRTVSLRSNFPPVFFALAAAAMVLSSCASVPGKPGADRQDKVDWTSIFAAYGAKPSDNGGPDRAKLETFLSANAEACADAASKTLASEDATREQFSGAADAAGFLGAEACLPALEAGLQNGDWFRRFACANAIDSIDSPTSEKAVLAALGDEPNGLVVMAFAMYLARHPSGEAQKLLERKHGEFSSRNDDDALLAQLFIEDALESK